MKGNTISITGGLTRDAEVKQINGKQLARFSIVWKRTIKTANGYEEKPSYFDCKLWLTDNQAQYVIPDLVRGAQVAIIGGHLEQETWTDENGKNKSRVYIIVDDAFSGLIIRNRNAEPMPVMEHEPVPVSVPTEPEPIPFVYENAPLKML